MPDPNPQERESERGARLRLFEVVAFGCHERTHKRLAQLLQEELGIHTFLFIEYFCEHPIPHGKGSAGWTSGKVFFPFIRRIVDDNQFISQVRAPVGDGGLPPLRLAFRTLPKTEENLEDFRDPAKFVFGGPHATVGQKVHAAWLQSHTPTYEQARMKALVEAWTKDDWINHIKARLFGEPRPDAQTRDVILKEYGLAGQPWVASNTDCRLFEVPVATAAVFYGYLLLIVPGGALSPLEDLGQEEKDALFRTPEEKRLEAIWDTLHDLAAKLYLPVLTLFAESRLEASLKNELEKDAHQKQWKTAAENWFRTTKASNPYRVDCESEPEVLRILKENKKDQHACCPKAARPYADDFELCFHKCWLRRMEALRKAPEGPRGRLEFLQRFPLARYFVASPGLVDRLRDVARANIKMKPEAEGLACALVYGGPGSGKDVMAQLIALLSDDYFGQSVYTLNMAAIRPSGITGPLLQGLRFEPSAAVQSVEVGAPGFKVTGEVYWQGLFMEAREIESRPAQPEEQAAGGAGENSSGKGATFILDELNSLSIELQGILLRVLEQGELMALGGLRKEYIQHLIIGVVNEDPEEITREDELRDLLVEKGKLGSLLSKLLYETLRRTRRLRDDLYHRLRKQLYIHLPAIKDRPEDVPMLFYYNAKDEAKSRGTESVIVELAGYRLLMDPKLTWPGNIRQIQAVAKQAVEAARDDKERNSPDSTHLSILRSDVLVALKAEFPEVFRDNGGR